MNLAYALIYCKDEPVNKSFVIPREQIQWIQTVDGETRKKGFTVKDFVSIKINGKNVQGRIVQMSSKY